MSSLIKPFYLKLDWDVNLDVDTWTERYINFINFYF